jgi:hypothetical protein
MEQMMRELKESFNLVDTSNEDDNIHPQNYSTEGGEKVLEDNKELVSENTVDTEQVEFSAECNTACEEIESSNTVESVDTEIENEIVADENSQDKFALTSNVVEEVIRVLYENKVQSEFGEYPKYIYVDCDFDASEVYCWDTFDWLLYGFTYNVNGDSISIDYDSKKRVKYVIADFDEGDQSSPFASTYELMKKKLQDNTELEAKYQNASDTIASMETELSELRKFKADTENAIEKDRRDEVLAQFNDLTGVEAFDNLCEHCMEYDVETLEEKCYAIRGKNGMFAKFALENKAPKLKVGKTNITKEEPYGGLFVEYGVESN